jgi:[acyl-carrier-protein] S-malonyltransferase
MTSAVLADPAQGTIAFVFPGGGSQYVGMGRDVYERYPAARRVFEEADATLAFSLSGLCFEGPEDELDDTLNAQPAGLTTGAALLAALRERVGDKLNPAFVAGHSTGEYTALLAAGVLDFKSALRLVRQRGRLMKEAGQKQPGTMAAVLGVDAASLQAICDEVGDVWLSNDNAPGQIVLSGREPAMERALQLAAQRGARRVIPLAVNIASHCPLMASAAESFATTVQELPLAMASVPIVANVSASPLVEPVDLRLELVQHLTSLVRWVESVRYMIAHGVQTFLEIGPKKVLSGLIKRIDHSVRVLTIAGVTDIETLEV